MKGDEDRLLETLRRTILGLIRREDRDLTARQLAAFLICYHESGPQTVRGLAENLKVARATISHILDRFEEDGLLRRKSDPLDHRSVLTARTAAGSAFVQDLKRIMADAAKAAEHFKAPPELPE